MSLIFLEKSVNLLLDAEVGIQRYSEDQEVAWCLGVAMHWEERYPKTKKNSIMVDAVEGASSMAWMEAVAFVRPFEDWAKTQ